MVGVGRDLCGSPSPTPCPSRVTHSRLHSTVSRRVLNISRGDSTASLGSLFQGQLFIRSSCGKRTVEGPKCKTTSPAAPQPSPHPWVQHPKPRSRQSLPAAGALGEQPFRTGLGTFGHARALGSEEVTPVPQPSVPAHRAKPYPAALRPE